MHACMNQTYSLWMLCFTHAYKINHCKKQIGRTINLSNQVAKIYTSAYHQHRSTRTEMMRRSMFSSNRYSINYPQTIQMPATISFRQRHEKQQSTTSLPIITTTLLRGDQPPNDDDHDNNNQDEIEAFVPLTNGVKNQPVTVQPIYFTNERDSTQRRITNTINEIWFKKKDIV